MAVVESVTSKAVELGLPMWVVSVDLTKAFDRVERRALFQALAQQGVPDEYVSLLSMLYKQQHGSLDGAPAFPINRGVRQGDVLSPLLFNAALEHVMRRWLARLPAKAGVKLDATSTNLTNLRYADDLLLFGKSLDEAVSMLELLQQELSAAGLTVNPKKTKLLTADASYYLNDVPILVDAGDGMVEVVGKGATHKYLGKALSGDPRARGEANLNHRLACGWAKFRSLSRTLLNQKIDVRLRLKLFDACVSPSVLYSLSTTPLTETQTKRLDAAQRRMMRSIVG